MVELELMTWKRYNAWHEYAATAKGEFHKMWEYNHIGTKKLYMIFAPNGVEYMAGYTNKDAKRTANKIFHAALNE